MCVCVCVCVCSVCLVVQSAKTISQVVITTTVLLEPVSQFCHVAAVMAAAGGEARLWQDCMVVLVVTDLLLHGVRSLHDQSRTGDE